MPLLLKFRIQEDEESPAECLGILIPLIFSVLMDADVYEGHEYPEGSDVLFMMILASFL
jgi:hypothetical protein